MKFTDKVLTARDVEGLMEEIVNGNGGDGDHHKNYHFDQLARKLLGDKYQEWRNDFQFDEDGEMIYDWDEGISS